MTEPQDNRRAPANRALRRAVLAGDMLAAILESLGPRDLGVFSKAAGPVLAAWEQAREDLRQRPVQQGFSVWDEGEAMPDRVVSFHASTLEV